MRFALRQQPEPQSEHMPMQVPNSMFAEGVVDAEDSPC